MNEKTGTLNEAQKRKAITIGIIREMISSNIYGTDERRKLIVEILRTDGVTIAQVHLMLSDILTHAEFKMFAAELIKEFGPALAAVKVK